MSPHRFLSTVEVGMLLAGYGDHALDGSLAGLARRNPGLAEAILSTAPPRWAPAPTTVPEPSGFSDRHELLGRLLYCPVEDALLDHTQPAPAPVRCPICGPVDTEVTR